jgi:spore coat polysaccharide biosynthesis protein SpsF
MKHASSNRCLVAAIACRNQGSRLYGKPLQNLNVQKGVTILDNIIGCLKSIKCIESIVLGVAAGIDNQVYVDYAQTIGVDYITGCETDVLSRLIKCGEHANATDIFRVTSESPFPNFDLVSSSWNAHLEGKNDATFLDDVIDGCGFEIVKLDALKTSHLEGTTKHRSELCTLYIRENRNDFRIGEVDPPAGMIRKDIRLTVDNPEDLILCRAAYSQFEAQAPRIQPLDIVEFLDQNDALKAMVSKYCEDGYSAMYL